MRRPYTDRAQAAVSLAEAIALEHGDDYPGPGHLLLGLLADEFSLAVAVLGRLGIDIASLRRAAMEGVEPDSGGRHAGDWRAGDTIRIILDGAEAEADALEHHLVGTEHLLLGLLRNERTGPAQLLAASGVDVVRAREQTKRFLSQYSPPSSREVGIPDETSEHGRLLARAKDELASVRDAKQRAFRDGDYGEAGRLRDVEKELLYRIATLRNSG